MRPIGRRTDYFVEHLLKLVRMNKLSPLMTSSPQLKIEDDFEEKEPVKKSFGCEEGAGVIICIAKKYTNLMDSKIQTTKDLDGYDGLELCGSIIPKISLVTYISRLVEMLDEIFGESSNISSTGMRCLMIASIYIDRLLQARPLFKLNNFNIHRVFFAAMIVAAKFSEDNAPTMNQFSQIGGVDVDQVIMIEYGFCKLMNWNFNIDSKILENKFDEFCIPLGVRFVL